MIADALKQLKHGLLAHLLSALVLRQQILCLRV
jgi:hypothetical protein